MAAFRALGFAASGRLLLLLALLGAFALAWRAVDAQTYIPLAVLVAYCLLVIFPIVGLEIRKRSPHQE